MKKKKHDVSWPQQIAYGGFGFGSTLVGGVLGSFLTLYLTDNLLLSAGFIAGMMFICRITNGIGELLVGLLIDRTKCKLGKARPWILVGSFTCALPVWLLFCTPASFSPLGRQIWVVVMYLLHTSVFGAMISVAAQTLTVKMSRQTHTRTSMSVINTLLGKIGNLITGSFGIPMLMYFGGYQYGYKWMSLIFCFVGFLAMLATGIFCHEIDDSSAPATKPAQPDTQDMQKKAQTSTQDAQPATQNAQQKTQQATLDVQQKAQPNAHLWWQYKCIFTNRYMILALLIYVLCFFSTMISGSSAVYFARDILKNAEFMAQITVATTIPTIILMLSGIVPFAVSKIGIQKTIFSTMIISVIGCLIMAFNPQSVTVIFIGQFICSIGFSVFGPILQTAVGEVADYINIKNKIDATGKVTSVCSAGMKIGMGLGSVGLMVALQLGKYSAEAANSGSAQLTSALFAEKASFIYVPLVCFALIALLSLGFNIEKKVAVLRKEQAASEN